MLAAARAASEKEGLTNLEVKHLDITDMSAITADSYDVVTVSLCFHLLTNPVKATAECARIMKPRGTLVATVWESIPNINLMTDSMAEVVGKPVNLPIDILQVSEGRADPMWPAAGLTPATGHNAIVPLTMRMGPEGGDDTWKLGMVMFMAKLAEMKAAGVPAFAKAKAAFDKNAAIYVNDGEIKVDMSFRVFVLTK